MMFGRVVNNCELDGGSYLKRARIYNQCVKAIWLSEMIRFFASSFCCSLRGLRFLCFSFFHFIGIP